MSDGVPVTDSCGRSSHSLELFHASHTHNQLEPGWCCRGRPDGNDAAPVGHRNGKGRSRPLRVPAQVNVLTWNICGGSQSSCAGKGTAEEKLDRVMQRVNEDSTLTVIALQEVCNYAHAARLQERLGDQWVVNFRAAPVMGGEHGQLNRCTLKNLPAPKDQPAGVLVAMKKLPGASITVVDEDFAGVPYANDKDGHPTQGAAACGTR